MPATGTVPSAFPVARPRSLSGPAAADGAKRGAPLTVFIIRRLMQSLLVLAAMTVIVFVGVYAIGNPIDILIAPDATQEERARAIASLGLDRPLWEQYAVYIGNMLQGDLGKSFVFNEPALQLVLQRLPATLELAVAAMLIAICIGIPLGLWAGLEPESIAGRSIMAGSILGFSLPNFWQGLMLIMIFAVFLGWLPAGGRGDPGTFLGMESTLFSVDGWSHLILPATNLALFKTSLVIRLTRAGVRETLPLDYVRFARAKGLSRRRVIFVHVLRNILIPLVTDPGAGAGHRHCLRGRDRDDLRLARHRQADHRLDLPARPAGHRRLPDRDRADVHHDQT